MIGALEQGERVAGYVLLGKLASGGMADVYIARKEGLGEFAKQVALKVILPSLADDPDFLRMFYNEAKLAALLNHPNVVQVFDFGAEGDVHFIAMEYLDGCSCYRITRTLEKQELPLPGPIALRIIADALGGLEYAHGLATADGRRLDVIHRDISLENIVVTYNGQVKVVDFGIAKARNLQSTTKLGTVKGKLSYMAPEVLLGEPVDRRADLFATAVVMYRLLTGEAPFDGDDVAEIRKNIIHAKPVPPCQRRPDLPASVERIILRGLAKDREARFATAREFRTAIEMYLAQARIAVSPFQLSEFMGKLFPSGSDMVRETFRKLTRCQISEELGIGTVETAVERPSGEEPTGGEEPTSRDASATDEHTRALADPLSGSELIPPSALEAIETAGATRPSAEVETRPGDTRPEPIEEPDTRPGKTEREDSLIPSGAFEVIEGSDPGDRATRETDIGPGAHPAEARAQASAGALEERPTDTFLEFSDLDTDGLGAAAGTVEAEVAREPTVEHDTGSPKIQVMSTAMGPGAVASLALENVTGPPAPRGTTTTEVPPVAPHADVLPGVLLPGAVAERRGRGWISWGWISWGWGWLNGAGGRRRWALAIGAGGALALVLLVAVVASLARSCDEPPALVASTPLDEGPSVLASPPAVPHRGARAVAGGGRDGGADDGGSGASAGGAARGGGDGSTAGGEVADGGQRAQVARGWLTVTAPEPASVYLDHSTRLGPVPLERFGVPAGTHLVSVYGKRPSYGIHRRVKIAPGRHLRLTLSPRHGSLELRIRPWARVKVDGRSRGSTPMPPLRLLEGRHVLELENPQLGVRRRRAVTIRPAKRTLLKIRLR